MSAEVCPCCGRPTCPDCGNPSISQDGYMCRCKQGHKWQVAERVYRT